MRTTTETGYVITDEPEAVDRDRLFGWLHDDAYWWTGGIHRTVLDTALEHSLCFSVLSPEGEFVGFGRMVTDRASFAYWADVYVAAEHRGRGLGQALTAVAVEHPELATCRRLLLATRDAHEVYARAGFTPLPRPEIFMEILRPDAGGQATTVVTA